MAIDPTASAQSQNKKKQFGGADLVDLCVAHWRWFALSLACCLALAIVKIYVTQKVYLRSATVLIKEEGGGGGMSQVASMFADMGSFGGASNVNNELEGFKSPALMLDVTSELALNVAYTAEGLLRDFTLYGSSQPFIMEFPGAERKAFYTVWGTMTPQGKITLTKFRKKIKKKKYTQKETIEVGTINTTDTVQTPYGPLIVRPNPRYDRKQLAEMKKSMDFRVTWQAPDDAVYDLAENLTADLANDLTSVINLTYPDVSVERSTDVLNSLIENYNKAWMQDKNQMSVATQEFIDGRLKTLERELGVIDSDIADYKAQHGIIDFNHEVEGSMKLMEASQDRFFQATSQQALIRQVKDYINDPDNAHKVLPSLSGTSDPGLEAAITAYNTQMLANERLRSSSPNNPIVRDNDKALGDMREAIVQSMDHALATIDKEVNQLNAMRAQTTSRFQAVPAQVRDLLGPGRDQKVKIQLYLFLLEKREENDLNRAFTAYNTRILTPPMGKSSPVAPNPVMLLIIAVVFGLLVPGLILYLQQVLDTAVRSRRQIEDAVRAPIAGELPHHGRRPSAWKRMRDMSRRRRGLDTADQDSEIVVRHAVGNPVNEAFRMLRSNLQMMDAAFVKANPGKGVVTMVTSAIPGSGKTFVSLNLASAITLKGKKVALVDLDLRKGTLSHIAGSPVIGVSSVLAGDAKVDSVVVRNIDGIDGLDLVPAGATPPNPAEILDNPRLKEMIEHLQGEYDAVIIDCPPSEAVSDAQIIGQWVNRTIYVVRIGNLHQEFLPNIERFFEEKRFANLTLVVNGVEARKGGSYGYGYGYGYGQKKEEKKK